MYYTIEIINWEWQTTITKNNRFYFADHTHPRIKRFRTQKAAREWLTANGFAPFFKNAKRPTLYKSAQNGMEARIVIDNGKNDSMMLGSERAMQIRVARVFA